MRFVCFLIFISLTGCASSTGYLDETYPKSKATIDMNYRAPNTNGDEVVDETKRAWMIAVRSDLKKILVSYTLGDAAAAGFAKGATFGSASIGIPVPEADNVANAYLKEKIGPNCATTRSSPVNEIQVEFQYECRVAQAMTPEPPKTKRR